MSNGELIKSLLVWQLDSQTKPLLRQRLSEAVAALEAHEWRTDMESAPPLDGDEFVAGLWVNHRDGRRWFEQYVVTVNSDGDYVDNQYSEPLPWHRDDFTHWKHIDTPPDTQNT